MRVLIIKTSAMGDILHALPVLSYLHTVKPGIEIDWVVEEAFSGLISEHPLISRRHIVSFRKWKKRLYSAATFRGANAVRQAIVERDYDFVFDIQGNTKSGMIAWLSGCPKRLGFTREFTQERLNTFFTNRQIPMRPSDRHITDQYLRIVSVPFGRDFRGMELNACMQFPEGDEKWAADFIRSLSADLVFLFHMGTTWQTKFWYQDGWAALGRTISIEYPGSVILLTWGNDAEHEEAEKVASMIGSCVLVPDRMPIQRLASVIGKVDLVLGGDTGVVHLAAALGTPTVSYYRSSDGMRSGPRGEQHRIIQAPMECTCCFDTKCSRDDICRKSVTPEMLFEAVRSVLQ